VTRSRGLLGLAVAAVAAAVVLCGAVIALALSRTGDDARAFAVPAQPSSLVRTPEALWVAMPSNGSLLALDPATGRPLAQPLPTGGSPSRLAAGGKSLWAVDSARASVVPLQREPARVFGAIPVGSDATDAAVAGGAVWVLSSTEGVVRAIQPGGRPVRELRVGAGAVDLAAGGDWLVVAGAGSGRLDRIDVDGLRPAGPPVMLGGVPAAAAVTGDVAWVADAQRGTVTKVDLRSGRRAGSPIDVGRRPVAVAAEGDDVYVLTRGDRTLVHIDGADGEVESRDPAGSDPVALALDGTHVWVADGGEETVLRFDR
jgi:DNA-binding beta-propeller fold protein YncE